MGSYALLFLAFIFVAAAFTQQQRLVLADHNAPFPPRQIAYLLRVYHQNSLAYKQQNTGVTGVISNPPPSMAAQPFFTSCADAKSVVTFPGGASAAASWVGGLGAYENAAVATEIARQSVQPPELGQVGQSALVAGYAGSTVPQIVPVPGVGLSTGSAIQSGAGQVALPAGCTVPVGRPAIRTQVIP